MKYKWTLAGIAVIAVTIFVAFALKPGRWVLLVTPFPVVAFGMGRWLDARNAADDLGHD